MLRAIIYTDGACKGNPGDCGAGIVIKDTQGRTLKEISEYLGEATNNVAEYKALLTGLEAAKNLGATDVMVKTDSELMARQLNGVYKVKAPHLASLYEQAMSLLRGFDSAEVVAVPREANSPADQLANEGVRKKPKTAKPHKPDQAANKTIEQPPSEKPEQAPLEDSLPTCRCRPASGSQITLVNGDCVSGMRTLVQDRSIDVVVTSPPYNIGVNYSQYNDKSSREEYLKWVQEWAGEVKRALAPKGSFFLNVGSKPSDPYVPYDIMGVMREYFTLQNTIVWVKSIAILKSEVGNYPGIVSDVVVGHYKPINSKRFVNDCAEFIFHFTHNGDVELDRNAIGVPYQDKTNIRRWKSGESAVHCRGNTWFIPYDTILNHDKDRPHPASFPVELPRRCIKLHGLSKTGKVLDPFMGIGSTGVACAELGVDFIGFEIAEHYVSTAKSRIESICSSNGRLDI